MGALFCFRYCYNIFFLYNVNVGYVFTAYPFFFSNKHTSFLTFSELCVKQKVVYIDKVSLFVCNYHSRLMFTEFFILLSLLFGRHFTAA